MKKFLVFLSLFFSQNAFAQYYFDDGVMNTAVNDLLAKSGEVSKSDYDSFWNIMGIDDKNRDLAAISRIKDSVLLKYQYKKEVLSCVEKSWSSKKVSNCSNANNSLGLFRAAKMRARDSSAVSAIENETKSLLEDAARGKIKDGNGVEIDLTAEVIKTKKAEIDNAISRLNRVLRMSY